jgi:hypothetical protein
MILCVYTYVEATVTGWKPNCSKINNNNNETIFYIKLKVTVLSLLSYSFLLLH